LTDTELIVDLLERSGVSKMNLRLVAEMLCTIDRLAQIDERGLQELRWVRPKDRSERTLLKSDKIIRILAERERILVGIDDPVERVNKLRSEHSTSVGVKRLADFLSAFVEAQIAARICATIRSLEEMLELFRTNNLKVLERISPGLPASLGPVLKRAITEPDVVGALQQVARDRRGYANLVAITLLANRITTEFEAFDVRRFVIGLPPEITASDWESIEGIVAFSLATALGVQTASDLALRIAKRSHYVLASELNPNERGVCFIFASAIKKTIADAVPKFADMAIRSTHPFLVRPLFRSYPSAITYAVGGKVASSLETTWGTVGEDLFLAMGSNLRSLRNGGIDVVDERCGYDIKSGPAIMNDDQIAVLHLKQQIIGVEKRIPSLDDFRVALVYGKRSDTFGTMVRDVDQGNIIVAREAWERLTGDPLAPERVYALAGLVADIVGVESSIAAGANENDKSEKLEENPSAYDSEFAEIFSNAFDPPRSRPAQSEARLAVVEQAVVKVRNLL